MRARFHMPGTTGISIVLVVLALTVSGCGQSDGPVVVPSGSRSFGGTVAGVVGAPPISCWDFNEGNGPTTEDGCDAHDGVLSDPGTMWTSTACGSAVEFDGVDDNVTMPGGAWLTQSKGTVEAWIKIHPDAPGGRIISTETAGWHNGFYISWGTQLSNDQFINGGIFGGIHSTEGSNHYVEAYIDDVSKGEWHFVAYVWDGDANSLMAFVDGNTSTLISPHPGIVDTGEPLTIGSWEVGDTHGGWFKGSVDQVKFYDRALSVDELNAHYVRCVPLDIRPRSCPNPLNLKSKGKLPVAILGSPELDVRDIDVSSLYLEGVPPRRSRIEDVSTPPAGATGCECTAAGGDGFDDLFLKFDTKAVVSALGSVLPGDIRTLTLNGTLLDGTPISAEDCVVIVPKKKHDDDDDDCELVNGEFESGFDGWTDRRQGPGLSAGVVEVVDVDGRSDVAHLDSRAGSNYYLRSNQTIATCGIVGGELSWDWKLAGIERNYGLATVWMEFIDGSSNVIGLYHVRRDTGDFAAYQCANIVAEQCTTTVAAVGCEQLTGTSFGWETKKLRFTRDFFDGLQCDAIDPAQVDSIRVWFQSYNNAGSGVDAYFDNFEYSKEDGDLEHEESEDTALLREHDRRGK